MHQTFDEISKHAYYLFTFIAMAMVFQSIFAHDYKY